MFHVPEQYRLIEGPQGSDMSYENNGLFVISHNNLIFWTIASDGLGWEHVSISLRFKPKNKNGKTIYDYVKRCPIWEEMCFIKDLFWDKEDAVVQFHPPNSLYVNCHSYCLHLWRPIGVKMPIPDPITVGPLNDN